MPQDNITWNSTPNFEDRWRAQAMQYNDKSWGLLVYYTCYWCSSLYCHSVTSLEARHWQWRNADGPLMEVCWQRGGSGGGMRQILVAVGYTGSPVLSLSCDTRGEHRCRTSMEAKELVYVWVGPYDPGSNEGGNLQIIYFHSTILTWS